MGINYKVGSSTVCPVDDDDNGNINIVSVIRKNSMNMNTSQDKVFFPTTHSDKSSISRQASNASNQSKTSRLTIQEELEPLREANIIFIRHTPQRIKSQPKLVQQNKYTVVNSCGETLFYAVEESQNPTEEQPPGTKADDSKGSSSKGFCPTSKDEVERGWQFVVVNPHGEEVFDMEGHPGGRGYGAHLAVRRDSQILGNIAQITREVSPSFSPCQRGHLGKLWGKLYTSYPSSTSSYLIEAADGRTLQKIVGQESWKNNVTLGILPVNDYNVCSPDGSICKAKISRQTNAITLEEYSQADTYAVSFHTTDMDGRVKALIMAAVLMLDFQLTFKKSETSRRGRDYLSLLMRLILCAFLIFILIALIVFIADSAIEFQREKVKRFPGQVPPP